MDMKKLNRRQAVSLLGGAAAVGAGSSFAGPAFGQAEPPKPAQLVVNHSGGSMGTAMRKAFFNGFEKKYGIKVVETSPVDFGKLRAMVDSGNVEWDLTEIGGQDAIRAGKANLLDKVDPKVVDRSKYPATAQNPFVFASSVYTTIIGYRTDVFKGGTQPKSPYWANKMLAELAIPQQQAVYASELGYPGLNLESLNFVDAKVKPYLPTNYLDKQFWISDEWYAENGTKAAELWNAWMLKKA